MKNLSSNMEDYLEAVVVLKKEKGVARVKDISKLLKVKSSSVTSALDTLSKEGLVIHEKYGYVQLTPEGEKLASNIQDKHNMLIKFFTEILKIDSNIASEDACKMEHALSPQTFEKLTKFIEFVKTCLQHCKPDWQKSLDCYFKTGGKKLKD